MDGTLPGEATYILNKSANEIATYQHLQKGANETLNNDELTPFRNHLAPLWSCFFKCGTVTFLPQTLINTIMPVMSIFSCLWVSMLLHRIGRVDSPKKLSKCNQRVEHTHHQIEVLGHFLLMFQISNMCKDLTRIYQNQTMHMFYFLYTWSTHRNVVCTYINIYTHYCN